MLNAEKFYRASDLITYPEVEARDADPISGTPKRSYRPERRGVLPYSETHFYRLVKAGKIPPPDAEVNGTRMWSGKLLNSFLLKSSQ